MSETGRSAERRPDRAALFVALGLAIIGAVILYQTSQMSAGAGYARIGPTAFPYVIGVALVGLSIWTAVAAMRGEFQAREPQAHAPVLWIVGGLVAQMLLLKPLGFAVATGLLFAATARGFGRGPLWFTIPLGIAISFAIWLLFAKGLQLSLPAGDVWTGLFAAPQS